MRPRALLVVLALLAPASAGAAEERDLRPVAARAITEVVGPAYDALAREAADQAALWRDTCATRRDGGSVERLGKAHRRTADVWAEIEYLRYGPVAEDFRAERIEHWPERRGATTRGLAALFAEAAEPSAASIHAASVGVQGLPVLERLLFDAGAAERLIRADAEGARACAIGRAVADNLAAVTAEVAAGWAGAGAIAARDPDRAREIVARLVTDALGETQTLIEAKLLPAMGKTTNAARPEALQGWRAGRVGAGFARPIAGLEALVPRLTAGADETATILATLATARSIAEDLPPDFAAALATPKGRSRAVLLRDALRSAASVLQSDLAALAGVEVGFNGRDGD